MTKINLISPQMFGADAAEADNGVLELINCYVENLSGTPVIKTRPGLTLVKNFSESTARVDLYWWEAGGFLIAVCAGRVYSRARSNGSWTERTPVSAEDKILSYNNVVMFAADENGVHMSTGSGILFWNGASAKVIKVTDTNLPSQITGLTYLKGYFIVSEQSTQNFYYATYGPTDERTGPPPWSSMFLTASASPDDIVTLQAGWEELFILGRESAESQYVTGEYLIPFRGLSGSAIETGLINRAVLQKMLDTWIYLNPNRQVIILQGRTPKVISKPIEAALYELDNYSSVVGFKLFDRFFILNFYTDQRTFVFDFESQSWYRWETWNNTRKIFEKFIGVSSAYSKPWGKQYTGGLDGKVYEVSKPVILDGYKFIRMKILTGSLDHGTLERKRCRELQFRVKRGEE